MKGQDTINITETRRLLLLGVYMGNQYMYWNTGKVTRGRYISVTSIAKPLLREQLLKIDRCPSEYAGHLGNLSITDKGMQTLIELSGGEV